MFPPDRRRNGKGGEKEGGGDKKLSLVITACSPILCSLSPIFFSLSLSLSLSLCSLYFRLGRGVHFFACASNKKLTK